MSLLRIRSDSPNILYTGNWGVTPGLFDIVSTTERGAIAEINFSGTGIVAYGAIPSSSQGPTPQSLITLTTPTLQNDRVFTTLFSPEILPDAGWIGGQVIFERNFSSFPFPANATMRIVNLIEGGHFALQAIEVLGDLGSAVVFGVDGGEALPEPTGPSSFPPNVSVRPTTAQFGPTRTLIAGPGETGSGPGGPSETDIPAASISTSRTPPGAVVGAVLGSLGGFALAVVLFNFFYFRRRAKNDQLTWATRSQKERGISKLNGFHELASGSTESSFNNRRRTVLTNDSQQHSSLTSMPLLRPRLKRSSTNGRLNIDSYYFSRTSTLVTPKEGEVLSDILELEALSSPTTTTHRSKSMKRASGRSTNSSIILPPLAFRSSDSIKQLSPAYNSPLGSEYGHYGPH
ncbi:hypothetical protein FA15DRAFT_705389 [Coprinopsis marcescibilis]|uniref:Uncharacterized protein n=1 Tax=Coprinopsis marcescibilis TaxID=230819 RepID=A0A5C3KSA1_COPMA|nr:hypothetical protein FA15DRAFT_705389 [Coprinopsis marcescibilis]